MTIDVFLRAMRRQWRAIALLVAVCCVAAGVVTMLMPRVYVATTTQFVRGVPGTGVAAEYQAAQFATARAKSYSVLLANPEVLTGIISDLKIQMSPVDLLARVSAENPLDTNLINVSARGSTPEEAQRISGAAADNLAQLIVRLESSGTTARKSPIAIQTAVPAPRPTSPASPRLPLNLAVAGLLGLALGIIVALARDARSHRRPTDDLDGTESAMREPVDPLEDDDGSAPALLEKPTRPASLSRASRAFTAQQPSAPEGPDKRARTS